MRERFRRLDPSTKLFLIAVLFVLYARFIHILFPSLWFLLANGVGFAIVGLIALFNQPKHFKELLDPACLFGGLALGNAFILPVIYYLSNAWAWAIVPVLAAGAVWCAAGLKNYAVKSEAALVLMPDERKTRFVPLMVTCFMLFCLCLRWTEFFPCGMSMDVSNQLAQIRGQIPYSNVHAIGHTLLLKGLLSLWNDPVVAIIFHFAILCALAFCTSSYFTRRGLPFGLQALVFGAFFSCSAGNDAFFYPWKDTPYAVCVGFLALLALLLCEELGSFGPGKAVGLGLSLAGILLFRLNGIVILLFFVPWAVVRLIRSKRTAMLLPAALAFALTLGAVYGYAYGVLHTKKPDNGFSIQVFGAGIAAALNDAPTEEELAAAEAFLPVDFIREHYNETWPRNLIWDREDIPEITGDPENDVFNNRFVLALGAHKKEAILLYFRLLPRHFWACFRVIANSTVDVWGYFGKISFFFSTVLLVVLPFLLAGRKRLSKTEWIVFLPMLLNALSIAISTITNEHRYFLPNVTVMPILLLLILAERAGKHEGIRKK